MKKLAIGIDLGGSQVRAALMDEAGTILNRFATPTAATIGASAVIEQLRQAAEKVAEGVARDLLVGVGVSAPGPLDAEKGIALATPTIVGFTDLPLALRLEAVLGLPVKLENDGIAAALGEWRFGAGRGVANFVYVTVSTGIGGGVVLDGRLLRGSRGMAAHIGHMVIAYDGELCPCGNKGCWEAYASGTAMARKARRLVLECDSELAKLGQRVDPPAIFDAAAAGDALARQLVEEEADLLGVGIANLLHLFSPDLVIVGGGLSHQFDKLRPGIERRIQASVMPPFRRVGLITAALGGNSGIVGAAALMFDHANGPLAG